MINDIGLHPPERLEEGHASSPLPSRIQRLVRLRGSWFYAPGGPTVKGFLPPTEASDPRPAPVTCGVAWTPAADARSAYHEIVSHVDRETCVLLETAFYGAPEGTPMGAALAGGR